jgi:glycosyltransferase involved in cell wall biosynthesis
MNSGILNDKYSVLMSVYRNDDPNFLTVAIESMLNQTIPPEQFVIVEDGIVGDEIEEVVSKYEKNSSLFSIVRLEKNGGLGNALNHGLKVCRNDLVARMDADDVSVPERCEKQLKAFAKNPDLKILGTQIKEFVGDTSNVVSTRFVPTSFEEIKKFARRRSPFNHPTVMYKKEAVEKLGGYPILKRKEDLGLFVNAVNNAYYSENLDESLLFYRTSVENQKRRKTWVNCKEYIEVMYAFFKKKQIGLADLAYVVFGQLMMYIAPSCITTKLSKKFLRT